MPNGLIAMRSLIAIALIGSGMLLAGCAGRQETPAVPDLLAQLRTGRAALDCRDACLADWRAAQPKAAQFETRAQWQDLAALVMRSRYRDDLSLYYLGRAAEGLGYLNAAAVYYRQSAQLSATSQSCQQLSRLCGGVALPRTAASRLAAIERELNAASQRRTAVPPPPRPATPSAAPGEAGTPPAREAVTPPAGDAGAPPARELREPVPAPRQPGASDYIEPPPAH
jgi:outer membrane murein-binding lipoprotein Lpp